MQFTKEIIKLAKPVYEAIPKIAEKAGKKWEWKPEVGEWYLCHCPGHELPCDCLIKDEDTIEKIKIGKRPYDNVIPLLHWEDDIERILKGMGYDTPFFFHFGPEDKYEQISCGIYKNDVFIAEGQGKDRQESVQRGILALVRKLEEKK